MRQEIWDSDISTGLTIFVFYSRRSLRRLMIVETDGPSWMKKRNLALTSGKRI